MPPNASVFEGIDRLVHSTFRPVRVATLTGLIVLLGWPALTRAHAPAGIDPSKIVRAVRISTALPRIDGRLDDDIWARVPSFSGFTQKVPDDGHPATDSSSSS